MTSLSLTVLPGHDQGWSFTTPCQGHEQLKIQRGIVTDEDSLNVSESLIDKADDVTITMSRRWFTKVSKQVQTFLVVKDPYLYFQSLVTRRCEASWRSYCCYKCQLIQTNYHTE